MEIIKISEALKQVGKPISGISGTIKTTFKPRTGTGQYGDWSMQDVVIKDETGEISATFSGMDDLKPRIGTRVTLSSTMARGVMKGLAVIEDSWTDKKTGQPRKSVKLKMDKDCFIDLGTIPVSDSPAQAVPLEVHQIPLDATDEEAEALRALEVARANKAKKLIEDAKLKAAQESSEKAPPVNGMSYAAVKRRIIQTANLYSYALRSAKWALSKHGMEISDLTTSAATLFIAFKEDKMVDAMPMNLILNDESENYVPHENEEKTIVDVTPQTDDLSGIDQEPRTWRDVEVNGKCLGDLLPLEVDELFNSFKPKIDPKTNNYSMQDLYIKNALLEWKKEQK